MKTTYMQTAGIAFILILLILFGLTVPAYTANDIDYITVNGVVKDKRNKKKLQYVSISIPNTNIGTVTNADGEFSIKVKDSLNAHSVEVSHLGYASQQIPITGENVENKIILLSSNSNLLDEVVINTMEPSLIVKTAIDNVSKNYNQQPNMLTGFYRETIQKKNNYINISEAIIDVYKSAYNRGVGGDKVQVLKGRKLISPKRGDTLIVNFQGGPTLSLFADIVKNPDLILNYESLPNYKFSLEESVMIDERPHFVVSFAPQVIAPFILFEGKLYIDKQSFTFSRAEYQMDMENKNKVTEAILIKKPFKLQFKPEEVSYVVTYKQRDGKSTLNYVQSKVRFKCDWKKKWIFSTNYTIMSEMVVTDSKTEDITKIPNKVAFQKHQVLSEKVSDFYDKGFWEDYNIIEPTESLESAINKLRKQ